MSRFAANLSMLFTEVPFLDRFELAAKSGFRGIEYLFPYAFPIGDLVDRLQSFSLTQVLHNLPAGDWEKGERGIAILPDRVPEFRAGVARAIEYALALGCKQVNCLAGIAPSGADPTKLHSVLKDNLSFAADELGRHGIKLLIEPVNTRDIPGFFLNHTRQAVSLIEEVGSDNLRIQYDIYHMQIMEGDLARTMESNLARIAHVQLADNPGRHEPGTGEIHYPFLFAHLDRLGYQGWIGCEYRPLKTTEAGLGWMQGGMR